MEYTPNEIETQFISAFTNLKDCLLSELIENDEKDNQMWETYHEIEALISRLNAGEEEITGPSFNQDEAS